jgi:hypothetical protein
MRRCGGERLKGREERRRKGRDRRRRGGRCGSSLLCQLGSVGLESSRYNEHHKATVTGGSWLHRLAVLAPQEK